MTDLTTTHVSHAAAVTVGGVEAADVQRRPADESLMAALGNWGAPLSQHDLLTALRSADVEKAWTGERGLFSQAANEIQRQNQHVAALTKALSMAATELEAATYFAAAEYCRTALAAVSQP